MPFALLLVGMLLIITGFQNTYQAFGSQVQKDFSGKDGFLYWIAAIGIVGGVGYVKPLEPISRAFLVLLIVVIFLSKGNAINKGGASIFSNFTSGLSEGASTEVNPIGAALSGGNGGGGGGGGRSDFVDTAIKVAGIALSL